MKGGRDFTNYNRNNVEALDTEVMDIDNNIPDVDFQYLYQLGFEEEELEMLFSDTNLQITENDLINLYLEIATNKPYCQNWDTIEDAVSSGYELNIDRYAGRRYNKRDIAEDTLGYIQEPEQLEPCVSGGKKNKKRKGRKTRKIRKTKKTRKGRKGGKRRTHRIKS